MSPTAIFLVGMGGLVGSLVLGVSWWFSRLRWSRGAMPSVPLLAIADVGEGRAARIVGKVVRADRTLVAPLSGRECVAWEVVLEQRDQLTDPVYRTLVVERDLSSCLIEDTTGRAYVHAEGGEIIVQGDPFFRTGTFERSTPQLEAFLARHGHSIESAFGDRRSLRFTEGAICVGDTASAVGLARWESDREAEPKRGYRGAAPRRLVLEPTEREPVFLSDDPAPLRHA